MCAVEAMLRAGRPQAAGRATAQSRDGCTLPADAATALLRPARGRRSAGCAAAVACILLAALRACRALQPSQQGSPVMDAARDGAPAHPALEVRAPEHGKAGNEGAQLLRVFASDMTVLMDLQSLPPAARELLQTDAAALRQRWEACKDAAVLETAIQQYKDALQAVLEECRRLGEEAGVPFERPGRLGGLGCSVMPARRLPVRSSHRGPPAVGSQPGAAAAWRHLAPAQNGWAPPASLVGAQVSTPRATMAPLPAAARRRRRRGRRASRAWTGGTARWKSWTPQSGRCALAVLVVCNCVPLYRLRLTRTLDHS